MPIIIVDGRWRSVRTPDERSQTAKTKVDALNPREKLMLQKVLAEWHATGRSKIVQEVSEIEWEEQPIPVREWLVDESLIGETGKDMYQQLREDFVELFEGDYHEAILCLHPDTRVPLLDGTAPTIKELADRWERSPEPFWVYGTENSTLVPAQAHHPRQTGVDDYFKVTLDDGASFTGNARHQMIMRDGIKRMIKDMAAGDSLMPFEPHGLKGVVSATTNRFVAKIEPVGRGPVYCMTVPRTTNFAISTSHSDREEVNPIRRSGVFSSNTGATGWGKDFFATTACLRMLYELNCLKNPQHTLGLAAGEPIHIVPISRTVASARRVVFGGIAKKLALAPWFRGKYEETMEEIRFRKKGILIVGGASGDAAALGLNTLFSICDECVGETTPILMANGAYVDAGDLWFNRKVACIELGNVAYEPFGPLAIMAYDNGKLVEAEGWIKPASFTDTYEVKLENGQMLRATERHPFLVRREDGSENYVWVRDLQVGDAVVTAEGGDERKQCLLSGARSSIRVLEPPCSYSEVSDAGDRTAGKRALGTARVVSVTHYGREQTYDLMSKPFGNFIANGMVVHNTNFLGEGKVSTGSASARSEDKATMIYNALARRVKNRYKRHGVRGMIMLISSKRSTTDFTERRIRQAVDKNERGIFVRDYCFTGDTRVPLLDGTTRTFEELVHAFGDGRPFWVYSIDPTTKLVRPGKAHHPRLTGRNAAIVAVTLDNEAVIRCTPEHQIMLRSGEYKAAGQLSPGERLMPVDCAVGESMTRSHTIERVVTAGFADVYDLSVEGFENFALDAGVFAHNCVWDVQPEPFKQSKWYRCAVSPKEGRCKVLEDENEEATPGALVFKFPEEFLEEFRNDPDGSARDIAGIATDFVGRLFITRRLAIDGIFDRQKASPFKVPEWIAGHLLSLQLNGVMTQNAAGEPVPVCCRGAIRHIHIDASTNGYATGFCMAHPAGTVEVWRRDPTTGAKVREDAPVVHVDGVLRIVAPDGGDIDHGEVRGLVYRLQQDGYPVRSIGMDQYCGPPNLQMFKRRGLRVEEVGERRFHLAPYLTLRQAIYEQRIVAPWHPGLDKELKELEFDEKTGKVRHGPKNSKDLADALAGVVYYITSNMRGGGTPLGPTFGISTTDPRMNGPLWTSGGEVVWPGDDDDGFSGGSISIDRKDEEGDYQSWIVKG